MNRELDTVEIMYDSIARRWVATAHYAAGQTHRISTATKAECQYQATRRWPTRRLRLFNRRGEHHYTIPPLANPTQEPQK